MSNYLSILPSGRERAMHNPKEDICGPGAPWITSFEKLWLCYTRGTFISLVFQPLPIALHLLLSMLSPCRCARSCFLYLSQTSVHPPCPALSSPTCLYPLPSCVNGKVKWRHAFLVCCNRDEATFSPYRSVRHD